MKVRPAKAAAVVAVLGLLVAGCSATSSAPDQAGPSGPSAATVELPSPSPSAVRLSVTAAPWQLPVAMSRAVVLPTQNRLLMAGGLDAANTTSRRVVQLDPTTGRATSVGTLPVPTHDAGGAVLGGMPFVFGGGSSSSVSAVQAVPPLTAPKTVGALPQPRSDLATAQVGGQAYLAGGYDGSTELPDVLRTSDGRHFTVAGRLAVPVRYPAVAATAGDLWVFGGEHAGRQVDLVQRMDLATGRTSVVAHLPRPLSHATALVLDGRILVAGGRRAGSPVSDVLELDLTRMVVREVGRLPRAASDSGGAVLNGVGYLLGGETPTALRSVVRLRLVADPAPSATPATPPGTAAAATLPAWLPAPQGPGHLAPGSDPSVLPGPVLIADKLNNRLLIVDPQGRVRWQFPRRGDLRPGQTFPIPDDAFFSPDGREIIATEEDAYVVTVIDIARHRIVHRYGHVQVAGSSAGYLNNPDDAIIRPDGRIALADIKNCRILLLNRSATAVARSYGQPGSCVHSPPHRFNSPNGAFPLRNGNLLITEIGGAWVDELTLSGRVVWSAHLAGVSYPSDTNEISPGRYLTVDYASPGQVLEFTRTGKVVWRYRPTGKRQLDHPSLALPLPNGMVLVNDDRNHRVIVIDPKTDRVVWQYGHTGVAGHRPGYLDNPDGMDLLPPYSLVATVGLSG